MNFKVTVSNQTFDVQIENIKSRPVLATVNGEVFEVHVEAEPTAAIASSTAPIATAAVPAATPAMSPAPTGANTIKAPIPGVITAVKSKSR